MTTPTSRPAQAYTRALEKLTVAEFGSVRAAVRRELLAEQKATRPTPTPRETPEIAAAADRMIRATGARIANGDGDHLPTLVQLTATADAQLHAAVTALRAGQNLQHAYSWADIGRLLGCSRQAAHERFGARLAPVRKVDPDQLAAVDDTGTVAAELVAP